MKINKFKFTRAIVLFSMVVTLLVMGCNYVFGGASDAQREYNIVVVSSGDRLWKIASEHNDLGDIRKKMNEIRKFNDMDSSDVYINQVLKIPVNN